ncbi:MAG: response regulator transcription factor, partial [Pseudoalteromonas distincta]
MDNYGTILLVEDDVSLAQWVAEYLTEQGYTTHVCHRGDEVISQVKTLNPNIVLLDIMLPGQDGISVCRELRSFYNSPIIMLTARDEEMDEVIGLEVGASDYIMKPVRPRALLARIKAALRQKNEPNTPHVNESVINVGALSIDTESRNVKLNEQDVNISSAEYLLLHYLASNAGQVVSRDAVFKATKGREYDGLDRSVDVLISALRKKFNDDPQNPEKIKTI